MVIDPQKEWQHEAEMQRWTDEVIGIRAKALIDSGMTASVAYEQAEKEYEEARHEQD
jgi:hypothetical protein